MPPKSKKKSALKKEVLADPNTLKSGNANHYIGGWSFAQALEDITNMSQEVVAAHTAEDRTVSPLPRTNVLILPLRRNEEEEEEEEAVAPEVIELADKMQVEGVSRKVIRTQEEMNVKSWELPPVVELAAAAAGETVAQPQAAAAPASAEETPAPAAAADGDGANAEDAAAADTADNAGEALETQNKEDVKEKEEGQAEEEAKEPPHVNPGNPLEAVTVSLGADFAAADVYLRGPIDIVGVLPQLVVKPDLPTPPQPAEPAVPQKKGRRKSSSKGSTAKSRRRKSAKKKLTPEQLAELEQKKAEEEALFLKKTEEAIALAAKQEDYLMTFAHPNRWSSVTIANVTFTGPVVVRRAHVVFQNCRFTATSAQKPQLTVSQYCTVRCVKCTFDAPTRCGLYVLPTAQVTVKRCLFTGVPHAELVRASDAAAAEEEAMRWLAGVVVGPDGKPTAPSPRAGGEDDGEDDEDAADGYGAATGHQQNSYTVGVAATGEPVVSPAIVEMSTTARTARPSSVGLQVDSAKVSIDDCRFIFLGSGVVLRGRYAFAPLNAGQTRSSRKVALTVAAASMALQNSQFRHLLSTAVVLDAHDVLVRRNIISDCEYYGLDCRGAACRNVSVQQNNFGFQAVVRIREKAHAALMHNEFHSVPINDNSSENPCMEATY